MPNISLTRRLPALAFLCAATCTAAPAASSTPMSPKPAHGSSKDFDFLCGNWIVHNRRLAKRLAGSTTWFVDNVGTFEGPDTFNDRPVVTRPVWKSVYANHAHWEQAFPTDKGKSWETNWTMEFVRRGPSSGRTTTAGIQHESD